MGESKVRIIGKKMNSGIWGKRKIIDINIKYLNNNGHRVEPWEYRK